MFIGRKDNKILSFDQILDLDISKKNVLIIGYPSSGKTYLSNTLKINNHKIIHTDDYMKYGFKDSIYRLLEDLKSIKENTVIEGVQGYRLLRKGVELNNYYPDIVIQLIISKEQIFSTYKKERENKNIKSLQGFLKTIDKILCGYLMLENNNKPEWFIINNNFIKEGKE